MIFTKISIRKHILVIIDKLSKDIIRVNVKLGTETIKKFSSTI